MDKGVIVAGLPVGESASSSGVASRVDRWSVATVVLGLFGMLALCDWSTHEGVAYASELGVASVVLGVLAAVCAVRAQACPIARLTSTRSDAVLIAASLLLPAHALLLSAPEYLCLLAAGLLTAGLWGASMYPVVTAGVVAGGASAAVAANSTGDVGGFAPALFLLAVCTGLGGWISARQQAHRKRAETELASMEGELAEGRKALQTERDRVDLDRAVDSSEDGHWHWDLKTDLCQFSANWCAQLGFEESEISNSPDEWLNRVHSHYLPQLKEDLSAHIYGRSDRFESQFRIQRRDGSYLWALARGQALRDADGNPTAVCGSLIDVTHLVQTERSVLDDAFHDRLTGLANRNAFMVRLERAVSENPRGSGLIAVLFMDLDRFKVVNDTHGHAVGDQLLSAAASRLKSCLRQRSGDMLARLGGDEFVLLMEDISTPDDAMGVAKRCLQVLKRPFRIGDHDIVSGGSVGIAFNNNDVDNAADLLRNADTAMYKAKASRKGEARVFNQQMYEETLRVYELETELSQALGRGELVLKYQPIIDLATGRVVVAEALLRWQRANGTEVPPSEFVPIAEENGEIEAIGAWVLQEAVRQNIVWQRMDLPPIKVAVNLSPRELQNSGFAKSVAGLLVRESLDPAWLELELTETALMENLEEAAATIGALRQLGVDVSIDDFGTGYSSLGYLRRMSFSSLKMDRSFVADLTEDPRSLAVAEGLIQLAHRLDLRVTAEGVESVEQLDILRRFGCDQLQGYLASRPLDVRDFGEVLRGKRSLLEAHVPVAV